LFGKSTEPDEMRIVVVADTFPPLRSSGAVQLRDLSLEFVRQGHETTVILPAPELRTPWLIEERDGVRVLRLRSPPTKDVSYLRRAVHEAIMPLSMMRNFRRSPLGIESWDGVVWYSPTIFLGPFAHMLRIRSECRGYLVVRDIFPEWAYDMGLMGRGLPYAIFKTVASYQYFVADVIGVQTKGNLDYFRRWQGRRGRRVEVLPNWLGVAATDACAIRIENTPLSGKHVFVYAGNMGVAQGMEILLDLAERLRARDDVGFLFVGRGSEFARMRALAETRGLTKVMFHDEIHPDHIPGLFAQCSAGVVALDSRHKSHNIPGKFLTYMQSGLPVLANVNRGNDLAELIRTERVGEVCESNSIDELRAKAESLLLDIRSDMTLSDRCRGLFRREFAVEKTVRQIVKGLSV
jgi:glycosyltransferase involved in cell wall biosynthesis